jgi:hypothetical protein
VSLDFEMAVTERHDGAGPVLLTAETQSRTRAGAMAHAFEALARGLEQEHHEERAKQ